MMNGKKEYRRLRPVAACLVFLLLVGTVTSLAQDEDLHSQAPAIDERPVVLSRTLTGNAVNVVVEIPVREDTYITSNYPSSNWCSSNFLRLGYSKDYPSNGAERIFLKFDLSSIPTDASINSARFRIYQHTITPAGDSSMRAESRHLLSDWSACKVTWSSHQPHWGAVFGSSWIPSTVGWLEADATELVKDWVYGNHPNYGAMIMGDETVRERQRIFYSREDSGGRYPRLIIDYTRYVDTQPPQASASPLPPWSPSRFTVSWSGRDPGGSGIDYFDVQYRVAGYIWMDWLSHTRAASADFVGGANGTTYQFRVRAVDKAGNVQAWSLQPQASTTVDAIPPAATANPLPAYMLSSAFTVSWTGSDNSGGSGIKSFDVQYQENGGAWQDWIIGTTATSVEVTGAQNGVTYGLRVRATDVAGNVQPWSATAQTETTVSTQGPTASIAPFKPNVTGKDQFTVRWSGQAPPGLTILSYDVLYRFKNGPWSLWQSQTTLAQAVFTDLDEEDGVYCFEVRATDSLGRTSDYMGQRCIAVDRNEPFIEPKAYFPLVSNADQP
jgi:hypothetical protein